MPSGDPFPRDQVMEIGRARTTAVAETGLMFSVYLGGVDGDIRVEAERLHAALGDRAADGVMVVVSPEDRLLEIVTGPVSARRLTDRACGLAALSMTTAFAGGDLVGGILTGLRMMSESAGHALPA